MLFQISTKNITLSSSVLCALGDFCSHGSSNLFSIGKYPFFIYEIEHKNFAPKKKKSLEKSRLFRAISFLSPLMAETERLELSRRCLDGLCP
jgi:hypothetical protein